MLKAVLLLIYVHIGFFSFFSIHSLEEGGQTALGPALLVATTLAGKVSGSKVPFLCICLKYTLLSVITLFIHLVFCSL